MAGTRRESRKEPVPPFLFGRNPLSGGGKGTGAGGARRGETPGMTFFTEQQICHYRLLMVCMTYFLIKFKFNIDKKQLKS